MLLIGLTKDGRWLQFSQVQLHLYMAMLKVMGLDWMLADEDWKGAAFAMGHPRTGRVLGAAARGGRGADDGRVAAGLRRTSRRVGRDHAARQRTARPPADAPPGRAGRAPRRRARPGAPARADSAPREDPRRAPWRRAAARRGRSRAARQPMAAPSADVSGPSEHGRAVRPGAGGRGRARARHVLRGAVRRHGAARARGPGDQGRADQGRADADPAAVPRARRGQGDAGQGEHRGRHVHRRGPGHRARAREAVAPGAAVVPGRGGAATGRGQRHAAAGQSGSGLPGRARLRHRRAVR